jgi:hypothetical protein
MQRRFMMSVLRRAYMPVFAAPSLLASVTSAAPTPVPSVPEVASAAFVAAPGAVVAPSPLSTRRSCDCCSRIFTT